MTDTIREDYAGRIKALELEAEQSGPLHRRDLYRAIKRMKGELRRYDAYMAEAKKKR